MHYVYLLQCLRWNSISRLQVLLGFLVTSSEMNGMLTCTSVRSEFVPEKKLNVGFFFFFFLYKYIIPGCLLPPL